MSLISIDYGSIGSIESIKPLRISVCTNSASAVSKNGYFYIVNSMFKKLNVKTISGSPNSWNIVINGVTYNNPSVGTSYPLNIDDNIRILVESTAGSWVEALVGVEFE